MSNFIFHSRPQAEADWTCQRYRFYAYDYDEGIVKDNLTIELFVGSVVHDALAAIATQYKADKKVDIDSITKVSKEHVFTTLKDYAGDVPEESAEYLQALEQSSLVEGLIRGYYKSVWPSLIAQYPEIIGIEHECIFPHDEYGKLTPKGPFVFMAKPDLILSNGDDWIYVEFKSTSTKKIEWINSWRTAMQVHATAKAIEFTLNKEVAGTIIQGLYKGSSNYGKFSSQLVYAYYNKGNPPFSKEAISHEFKSGLKRTPIWNIEGGMSSWVNKIPSEVLSEQFPQTPLISINDAMCDDFFHQRALREQSISKIIPFLKDPATQESARKLILNTHYPQSFSQCSQAWGKECPFYRICHGPADVDPLSFGFIQKNREHQEAYKELAAKLLG